MTEPVVYSNNARYFSEPRPNHYYVAPVRSTPDRAYLAIGAVAFLAVLIIITRK